MGNVDGFTPVSSREHRLEQRFSEIGLTPRASSSLPKVGNTDPIKSIVLRSMDVAMSPFNRSRKQ